jgi:hypothetical protein
MIMNLEAELEAYRIASQAEWEGRLGLDEAKEVLQKRCAPATAVLTKKLKRLVAGKPWEVGRVVVWPQINHGKRPLTCEILMDATLTYRNGNVNVDVRAHGSWADADKILEAAKHAVMWKQVKDE